MNYLKSFLKGFVDGFYSILDPKFFSMLLLGIIVFLSLAAFAFIESQIIIGIVFVYNAINCILNYIWNRYTQSNIIAIVGLSISIIALIIIIFICF